MPTNQEGENPCRKCIVPIVNPSDILATNTSYHNGVSHYPNTMKSTRYSTPDISHLRRRTWKFIRTFKKMYSPLGFSFNVVPLQ
jgi:hypothetical protein